MEIGQRIRSLRNSRDWNQDIFAEKMFVSRQTVSSWENGRSYPDIKSLLLMSDLFGTSLDELIKGDIEKMKLEISSESIREYNRWANLFAAGLIIGVIIPYPLAKLFGWWGLAAFILYIIALFPLALKVEALKKQNDIQTYKEITAFVEGRELSKEEKISEKAKRPYQKILLAIGSGAITLCIFLILYLIFG
ncbi:MAG: helix-turn-helix transcriptional regulator [Clostridiales bacterium]|nr:helix-turn-helix transcriptional regulator [Clostridiales bacterium]